MADNHFGKQATTSAWERYDRKVAKKREAEEADARKIIARAAEISAGSKLRFDEYSMQTALRAFIDATRVLERSGGDPRDYVSAFGVNTLSGRPWCSACQDSFTSERAYANHMMSAGHAFKKVGIAAVMEARAHIHAFPIDDNDYGSMNGYKILENYRFRNL